MLTLPLFHEYLVSVWSGGPSAKHLDRLREVVLDTYLALVVGSGLGQKSIHFCVRLLL